MSAEQPIPLAATVVLLTEGDSGPRVLMVRRRRELAFYGGAWVFPGGRVDAADYPSDASPQAPMDDAAARAAAVREVAEEVGLTLDGAVLSHFAQWITPKGRPRRFDTYFFAAPLPPGNVLLDRGEVDAHRLFTPQEALAARAKGEIQLPPPTFVTLTTIAKAQNVEEALHLLDRPAQRIVPRPVATPSGAVFLYPGDAGYEALDPDRPGLRHRLTVVDNEYVYEKSQ